MQPGTQFSFHASGVRNYGVVLKGGQAILLRLGGIEEEVTKGTIPHNAEAISLNNPARGTAMPTLSIGTTMNVINTFFKTAILMMGEE